MREQFRSTQADLTNQAQNPYSRGGEHFMAEPGQTEGPLVPPPASQTARENFRPQQKPVSPERIKLVRKAWEAHNAGRKLGPDERTTQEMAIQMGIAPIGGGAEAITETFTDHTLQNVVGEINQEVNKVGAGSPLDPEFIREQLQLVRSRRDTEPTSRDEAQRLLEILNSFRAETRRALEEGQMRFGIYLQPEDIKRLSMPDEAIQWLDDQFNTLYKLAQEGQELTSPVVTNMQTVVSEAIRYLQYHNPGILDRFQQLFTIRFNLMQMRTVIGYRDIDSIKSAAFRLQTHGLLYGLSMEEGRVGAMFNRLHELMEDERLKKGPLQHVTPEIANQLQEKVIKEQMDLAEKGVGIFGKLSLKGIENEKRIEQVKADITRAVRTAYDIFVSSQRQAVIVARGRRLTGPDAYFSDPASGPLNVYNLEDLLLKKFDIYNLHDEEFVRRIKLDMAESSIKEKVDEIRKNAKDDNRPLTPDETREIFKLKGLSEEQKEDLGRRLFRDLFAVPDFFSSGWRIKGILESIDERFEALYGKEGIEKAKDFALFLRLKAPKEYVNKEDKKDAWSRIAEIRPEEIVRLFRERASGSADLEARLHELFRNPVFKDIGGGEDNTDGFKLYDKFKDEFGVIMGLLRQRRYEQLQPLKIAREGFSPDEEGDIQKWFDGRYAAVQVRAMYEAMTNFAKNAIEDLLEHEKFKDIDTRTILVDDALLHQLEETRFKYKAKDKDGKLIEVVAKDKKGDDISFVPLSKKYAADQGGDALVRIWTDTGNAVKAGQALVGFIKVEDEKEKLKHALELGDATSQYNGQKEGARCIRYTMGTYLNLAKGELFWDVLGISKLPFRLPMSELEKIYGPQAKPMSRDELRHYLDQIHIRLLGALDKESLEDKGLSVEERLKKKIENKEKAEKIYRELEKVLEVTTKDITKRRAFSFLIFLIFAAVLEAYEIADIKGLAGKK